MQNGAEYPSLIAIQTKVFIFKDCVNSAKQSNRILWAEIQP